MIFNQGGGGIVPKVTLDDTTITPGTEDQVVDALTYLRGDLTVLGDPDLVPGNIVKGANIFGVVGTYGGVLIEYTFTGQSQIIYDKVESNGNSFLEITLKLLSSGILNVKSLKTPINDVYVVGGGGGGAQGNQGIGGGGGGGGAYLSSQKKVEIPLNEDINIVIGTGGAGGTASSHAGKNGGQSSAFGIIANGGSGATGNNGGNGGSGGGAGGWDSTPGAVGTGDNKSKEILGKLYCGGGGAGISYGAGGVGGSNGSNGYSAENIPSGMDRGAGGAGGGGSTNSQGIAGKGSPNTGGGGAGGKGDPYGDGENGASGGSGIVIIKGRFS